METLSTAQAAELAGVSTRRMYQIAKEADAPDKTKSGQYPAVEYGKWLRQRYKSELGIQDDGTLLNLEQERARLAAAQADKTEMENKIKQGEYAPMEILTFAIADVASQWNAIIESVPAKIKRSMPQLRAREMKILVKEFNNMRNAVTGIQVKFNIDDG